MRRGKLLVIEGCDRSGKTTQCQMLLDKLNSSGFPTVLQKFPDRTTATGQIIDQYLRNATELDDHAIHLLFSANRWESMKSLQNTLELGTNVLVDRYAFSGVAFSASKGLDIEWCKNCDVGLLKPDLVLFLDLEPNVAAQRGEYGQERYEKLEFQAKARKSFYQLSDASWKIVNADKTIDSLHEEIHGIIADELTSSLERPLEYSLWK